MKMKWWNRFLWYVHGYNYSWAVRVRIADQTTAIMDYPTEEKARKHYLELTTQWDGISVVELLQSGNIVAWKDLTMSCI